MRKDKKVFVWYDKDSQGRNLYGEFRRTLNVNEIPESAVINIFADKVYQLKVNGKFVGFGPVRFDPRFPQFDSYDIASLLNPGKNSITVLVNYFGMKTYKSIPSKAGLCVWGNISGEEIGTGSPGWKAKPSLARQHYMQKISFALDPIEIIEQKYEEKDWTLPSFDDSEWPDVVALDSQNAWGSFEKRSIPLFKFEEIKINTTAKILPINNDFDIYGFELPLPTFYDDNSHDFSYLIAYSTWIWSPCQQNVVANVFWGELWINNKELTNRLQDNTQNMKFNQVWPLNEGWNYMFGKIGGYNDYLNHIVAVPKSSNLVFAADKKMDSKYPFKHTPQLDKATYASTLEKLQFPYSSKETLDDIGGWVFAEKTSTYYSPCKTMSWDNYGDIFQTFHPDLPNTFRKEFYPQGFSILFDLENTKLIFPRIKLKGVLGATVEMAYSESLLPCGLRLEIAPMYQPCDQIFCSQDKVEFQPMQPRGMRYLVLTVTKASNDVTLENIKFIDASYPVEEIGSFECSDELLNQIWKQCMLTQRTNMEDAYVDCVTRERGMYIRDTIIQYYNNQVVFGDQPLMHRCMQLYGQSPDSSGKYRAVYPNSGTYTISDFCLNAIEGYHAQYKFSGDTSAIKRDWSAMKANLKWFDDLADEREDKLLDANWNTNRGVYANYGGFHGDLIHSKEKQVDTDGIHCVFTCTYLVALDKMVEMAIAIDLKDEAATIQQRADFIRNNSKALFFDESVGLYKDSLTSEIHSYHAQLSAIRANVASEEQIVLIKKHIEKTLLSVFLNGYDPYEGVRFSPSYAFYIFEGLYMAGLYEVAENLIRSGWGYFLYKGYTQIPEYHVISQGTSYCHAWSACPLYYLSSAFSGIEYPDDKDLNSYSLNVKSSTVEWAKVKLPHPKGVIEVEWHMEDGIRVFDKIAAPDGVELRMN